MSFDISGSKADLNRLLDRKAALNIIIADQDPPVWGYDDGPWGGRYIESCSDEYREREKINREIQLCHAKIALQAAYDAIPQFHDEEPLKTVWTVIHYYFPGAERGDRPYDWPQIQRAYKSAEGNGSDLIRAFMGVVSFVRREYDIPYI